MGDAIGNFTLQLRDFLNTNGMHCKLYARYYDEAADLGITDLEVVFDEISSDDVLISQYSIYDPALEPLASVEVKSKIVYYHGITPPIYFEGIDSETAVNCAKGRQQYIHFKSYDYFIANSRFMLDELLQSVFDSSPKIESLLKDYSLVMPPALTFNDWDSVANEEVPIDYSKNILLYVGRVAPHKRIEDLVDWFAHYHKHDPDSYLVIVGADSPSNYGWSIRDKVASYGGGLETVVQLTGTVTQGQLKTLYQRSTAMVTLSEHEGFCLPLLEAMYFGVPVIARNVAAIPETLGRTDYLLDQQPLAAFAAECYDMLSNEEKSAALLTVQKKQLETILSRCSGAELLKLLHGILS